MKKHLLTAILMAAVMLLSAFSAAALTLDVPLGVLEAEEKTAAAVLADGGALTLFTEDFETFATGAGASTVGERLQLSDTGDDELYFYMGDYTTPFSVQPDPLDEDNMALCMNNSGVKMIEIDRTRNAFALGYTAPGKYVLRARILVPSSSEVSEAIMSVVTSASGNNGYQKANITAKGAWQDCYAELIIGPDETDTELKAVKFWNWPGKDGEIWIDDVQLDYYPLKVVVYTDDTKTTVLSTDYAADGMKWHFPAMNAFASSVGAGQKLVGLNIAGNVYAYGQSYTVDEDDATAGVIEVYPVIENGAPLKIMYEDFESHLLSTTATWAGASVPVNGVLASDWKFWMGGYTTPMTVLADPLDSGNQAFKLTNTGIKMVQVEKTRNASDLNLTDPGKYVVKSKIYIPNDSGVTEARMSVITNASGSNGYIVSTSTKGSWQPLSYELIVDPEGTDTTLGAIRFWNYPGMDGEFWVDDIEIDYYGIKTVVYSDSTKSTVVTTTYGAEGERFIYPIKSLFASYVPAGEILAGFVIGDRQYAYSDNYIFDSADLENGELAIYPYYINGATKPIMEDFEGYAAGTQATWAGASVPVQGAVATDYKFWMGGYTTPIIILPDPLDETNAAMRLTNSGIKMIQLEKTRNASDLNLTDPGKYVVKSKIYIPNDSGVTEARMSVITNASGGNGYIVSTSTKGSWQPLSYELIVDPEGTDTTLGAIRFWNYPGMDGEFWVDDIEVDYYGTKAVVYSDSTKSTVITTTYGAEGEPFLFPQKSVFASYVPQGRMLIGLNIGGTVYEYTDTYYFSSSDMENGELAIYPVYTDEDDPRLIYETFEGYPAGATATWAGASVPVLGAVATDYKFWMGDYTSPMIVLADPLDENNYAMRVTNSGIKMIQLEKNRRAFDLGLSTEGIYTASADIYIPTDSSVSEVMMSVITDHSGSNGYSTSCRTKGAWTTVTYEIDIGPDEDDTSFGAIKFWNYPGMDGEFWIDNITLTYAPFPEPTYEPETLNETSVRVTGINGLRFSGFISAEKAAAVDEFGFMATRASFFEGDYADFVLSDGFVASGAQNYAGTTSSGKTFVSCASYNSLAGLNRTSVVADGETAGFRFNAVLIGMTGKAQFTETFAVRPYAVLGANRFYGEVKEQDLYTAAKAAAAAGDESEYVANIIAVCEADD